MNFNLSPRCIWLTRHGESTDNLIGKIGKEHFMLQEQCAIGKPNSKRGCKWLTPCGLFLSFTIIIGGDAPLSGRGKKYGDCLSRFIQHQRQENEKSRRVEAEAGMAISPLRERTVAVWTSMLTRTKETVEGFDPKEYDIKHIRFLNEIYAGECPLQLDGEFKSTSNRLDMRFMQSMS
jgi:6-phosphofructo-2-kinase